MLLFEHSCGRAAWKLDLPLIHPALLTLLLLTVVGCNGEGPGGPIISSISTPTDETGAVDSDQAQGSDMVDDGEQDPVITMASTPDGVTANLTWGRPHEFNVTGYSVHYGIRPLEEPGSLESSSDGETSEEFSSEESNSEAPNSCSQGESQAVGAQRAIIFGLEPNTRYFFAIRAFNETESLCSNEVTVVTPSAQS
jgi:hypothetical protein